MLAGPQFENPCATSSPDAASQAEPPRWKRANYDHATDTLFETTTRVLVQANFLGGKRVRPTVIDEETPNRRMS